MNHFVSMKDFTKERLLEVLELAKSLEMTSNLNLAKILQKIKVFE